MKSKGILLAMLVCIASINLACPATQWETNTYATLSTAKSTIDCASAGYNHDDAAIAKYCSGVTTPSTMYLPQTAQIHDLLQTTGQAKDVAVNAMITYEASKAAKNSTDQASMQANVDTAVGALSADVAQVVALIKNGGK